MGTKTDVKLKIIFSIIRFIACNMYVKQNRQKLKYSLQNDYNNKKYKQQQIRKISKKISNKVNN